MDGIKTIDYLEEDHKIIDPMVQADMRWAAIPQPI